MNKKSLCLLRGAQSLHSPGHVIARSDSDEAISKRDCHALWARNDTLPLVQNVTYFMHSVIRKSKLGIWGLLFLSIVFIKDPSVVSAQQHGDLVRIQGEEKIYLIQSGQRRAIASEEVFSQMGFKTEDVKELDAQTVMSIPEGPPLWSKEAIAPYPDGTLIRLKGKAQAYVIRRGRKCYIPDPETFQAYGFQWDQVIEVEPSNFNKIPTDIPIASVKPPYQYGQPGMPPSAYPGSPPSPYPPPTLPSLGLSPSNLSAFSVSPFNYSTGSTISISSSFWLPSSILSASNLSFSTISVSPTLQSSNSFLSAVTNVSTLYLTPFATLLSPSTRR